LEPAVTLKDPDTGVAGSDPAAEADDARPVASGIRLRMLLLVAAATSFMVIAFVSIFILETSRRETDDAARTAASVDAVLRAQSADGTQALRSGMDLLLRDQDPEAFEDIVQRIKTLLDVDVFVAIDKSFLDRAKWDERQGGKTRPVPWNELPAVVVPSRTTPAIPAPIAAYLGTLKDHPRERPFEIAWDGRVARTIVVPLANPRGQQVGELVVVRDVTTAATHRRQVAIGIAILGAIIGGGLTLLSHVLLGRVQRDAVERAARLGVTRRVLSIVEFERKRAKRELDLQAEINIQYERFNAAIDNMPQGLCMLDGEQKLIICNLRYAEIYGLDPKDVVPGTSLRDILTQRAAASISTESTQDYVEERLAAVTSGQPTYSTYELANGRVVAISNQPMPSGGSVATHEDITERREAEAQIEHLAHYDALTGLPNRVSFRRDMDRALGHVERGDALAVLCLDLDHFKEVNDTLGHPIGDGLLQEVADRIRACVRTTDSIARLGGDEFAIVQFPADPPVDCIALATRLIAVLTEPYDIDGHQIVIGASIGIAVAPGDGKDFDRLLKHADMALYRAKEDGRGVYRFFEPEMDARMQTRRALELDLRKALALGEFELFYQPVVGVETNTVTGFEALLRWWHPERGLILPGEFIPLAEEIGLIGPIGAWTLKQACTEAAGWPGDITVAVNLSPAQFKSGTLVLDVIAALGESGLPARRLELEITETVLLQDTGSTMLTLNQLKALGVHIAMDDFGTGYSSLGYLQKFPFDKIKIDQSFVRDLLDIPQSIAIVRAVTGLGTTLGITTTAEGVETADQLEQLRREGCTEVQGYLFSKPKQAHELAEVLFQLNADAKSVA
jgi:diguanylate cyclase (GGDEF)-like protein/PAS domain S-box-containing protein